jgi:hypothetical protein
METVRAFHLVGRRFGRALHSWKRRGSTCCVALTEAQSGKIITPDVLSYESL